ncbi:MAG: hypothetical protein UIC65_05275 [Alphaproteobacteria bacterium]|nr:hypothetical protein [Alphaproteobacteria bacterium]
MSETFQTIQEWGIKTFGNNITMEGQIQKWIDERKEFEETSAMTPDELFELADLVIVSANIMRFDFKTGFHYLAETFKLLAVTKYSGEELWNAVEKKMTINKNRVWTIGKGNYQHIEEGE